MQLWWTDFGTKNPKEPLDFPMQNVYLKVTVVLEKDLLEYQIPITD